MQARSASDAGVGGRAGAAAGRTVVGWKGPPSTLKAGVGTPLSPTSGSSAGRSVSWSCISLLDRSLPLWAEPIFVRPCVFILFCFILFERESEERDLGCASGFLCLKC